MTFFSRFFATVLVCLGSSLLLPAQQTFWGTASQGGAFGQGTLYSITSTSTFTKKHDFLRYVGAAPRTEIIKAVNGLYYGTTRNGGTNGVGLLFSYDPATGVYTVLHNFVSATHGSSPEGGVIQASNGRLYGLCRTGGSSNLGTMWEYNPATSTFTNRLNFTGTATGSGPVGRPVQAGNGNLYYVTTAGGTNSVGALYEFNPTTNVSTRRFVFTAANGSAPSRGLIVASNGLLYGTTSAGGTNSVGALYSFNTTGFVYTKLFDMTVANGSAPIGELMQASDGHLYGTTSTGGTNGNGVIFRYNITTPGYTKLFDMASATGSTPYGRMIQAANGLLYGMTNSGGTSNTGVLYSFDPAGPIYTALLNLASQSVGNPFSSVIEDPVGNLVGTCSTGGSGSSGVLFKYTIGSGQFNVLIAFGASNGANPWNSPVRAANGKFYGVTSAGGVNDAGVIYSFDPATNTYVKLVDLGLGLGRYPFGRPILIGNKLFGVCNQAGAFSSGTLFEYDIITQVYTVRMDFQSSTGFRPLCGMVLGDDGKLYGNTTEGGTFGYGTFFSFDPTTSTYTIHKHHRPQDGTMPLGDPFKASNGIIYGALSESAVLGFGAIYQFNPITGIYAKVLDMAGTTDGAAPSGGMAQATNGKLYGLAGGGGANGNGCVYEWTIGSPTPYANVHDLTTPQGASSESGLLAGTDGAVYGSCAEGGTGNFGTLIKYDPATDVLTILKTLTNTDGIFPYDGLSYDNIPSSSNIAVDIKVYMEGPYNSGTGLMGDALRSLGSFPLTEPYTGAGFTLAGGGGESIAASVLTTAGNNAIVDWVLLELRDKNNSSTVLRSKCVLVQRDGDVVDLDGVSPVSFPMPADQYFIAVRHRNHLAAMTLNPVSLSSAPATVDFRDAGLATFGTDARKTIGSARALWAGNVVPDAIVRYTGSNNDRDPILVRVGGAVPTTTVNGYWPEDVNLDGVVKYTGSANDRDPILTNIGGTVPTGTRPQQLP